MKAFITGGAGFLGSHLCELLLKEGYSIDVLDDLSTGRIDNLPKSDRLKLHLGIANYPPIVTPLIKSADIVFHLAAIVGVNRVLQLPVLTLERNIESTACVLNYAAKRGVPVVMTSSSEVYGRSLSPLLSEDADLHIGAHPRWGYAAGKLVEEFLALARFKANGLPVVVVRLFNAIGPRQNAAYGSVVPRMLGQALTGEPITVYGDGHQSRAFTWVGDTVECLYRLSKTREAAGEIVNVGHPGSISISNLAQLIKSLTSSSSEIAHVGQQEAYGCTFADIEHRLPDVAKLRQLIGTSPKVEVDDAIAMILKERTAATTA